jgi:hypothetical protein
VPPIWDARSILDIGNAGAATASTITVDPSAAPLVVTGPIVAKLRRRLRRRAIAFRRSARKLAA